MDTVGTRITEARKAKGWSQTDLANAVFVTQTCISYWERDERSITVRDLLTVAAALAVPAVDLIPDITYQFAKSPVLDLTCLTADLREILYRLERSVRTPATVIGWVSMPTTTCDTRTGRHWHLFLHTNSGTSLRIGGLHFNTEPEARSWGEANLWLRQITTHSE